MTTNNIYSTPADSEWQAHERRTDHYRDDAGVRHWKPKGWTVAEWKQHRADKNGQDTDPVAAAEALMARRGVRTGEPTKPKGWTDEEWHDARDGHPDSEPDNESGDPFQLAAAVMRQPWQSPDGRGGWA